MKFNHIIIMFIWGFIVIMNAAAYNWPAAINAGAVIFYIFVVEHLKKQIKEAE